MAGPCATRGYSHSASEPTNISARKRVQVRRAASAAARSRSRSCPAARRRTSCRRRGGGLQRQALVASSGQCAGRCRRTRRRSVPRRGPAARRRGGCDGADRLGEAFARGLAPRQVPGSAAVVRWRPHHPQHQGNQQQPGTASRRNTVGRDTPRVRRRSAATSGRRRSWRPRRRCRAQCRGAVRPPRTRWTAPS